MTIKVASCSILTQATCPSFASFVQMPLHLSFISWVLGGLWLLFLLPYVLVWSLHRESEAPFVKKYPSHWLGRWNGQVHLHRHKIHLLSPTLSPLTGLATPSYLVHSGMGLLVFGLV